VLAGVLSWVGQDGVHGSMGLACCMLLRMILCRSHPQLRAINAGRASLASQRGRAMQAQVGSTEARVGFHQSCRVSCTAGCHSADSKISNSHRTGCCPVSCPKLQSIQDGSSEWRSRCSCSGEQSGRAYMRQEDELDHLHMAVMRCHVQGGGPHGAVQRHVVHGGPQHQAGPAVQQQLDCLDFLVPDSDVQGGVPERIPHVDEAAREGRDTLRSV
jgi:hypothetical protein